MATPPLPASTAGAVDKTGGRAVAPADGFVWGSITKMVTGASVLRLVDQQKLALTDAVAPIIDPFLAKLKAKDPAQNFSKLSELWGDEVSAITVLDLLAMRSGVPDYDTASPSGRQPSDSFRADACAAQFAAQFSAQFGAQFPDARTIRVLSGTRTRRGATRRPTCSACRGWRPARSSFLPARATRASTTTATRARTRAPRPPPRAARGRRRLDDVRAAGAARAGGARLHRRAVRRHRRARRVHAGQGYDTTHYNNNTKAIDVSTISGVFGGWTAADFVAPAADAAALAQDLYGPSHKLVSASLAQRMYDESSLTGYGLATFNLTRLTPHDVAMGHLGATYGYQSVVAYVPKVELAVAVGTNIERDEQDQPADVFCHVYNTAAAILQGLPVPTCTYSRGYWSGGCKCH